MRLLLLLCSGWCAARDAGRSPWDLSVELRYGVHRSTPGAFNALMGSYRLPQVYASGPDMGVSTMLIDERMAFGVTTLHALNDAPTVDPFVGAMIHDGFLLDAGPVLNAGRHHRVYALAGLGYIVGRMLLQLNSKPGLDATLRDPLRGIVLEQPTYLLHLGVGGQRWWITPGYLPGPRRWGLGAAAGYLFGSPHHRATKQPWTIEGTPFGITGPYAEIGLLIG